MTNFAEYGNYYDLLYRDKDYAAETDYVHRVIERYRSGQCDRGQRLRILDLGCGTGRHAQCLAQRGYAVLGVDRSETMLAQARRRSSDLGELRFVTGDVRSLHIGERFDCVLALFHVASYQTSNDDICAMLEVAARHLSPGGLFVFDFWYGPGVLTERPAPRVKRLESEDLEVIRVAQPEMSAQEDVVAVHYTIVIRDRHSGQSSVITEEHRMRYFFMPEIELLLAQAGMRLLGAEEWVTGAALDLHAWNGLVVATR